MTIQSISEYYTENGKYISFHYVSEDEAKMMLKARNMADSIKFFEKRLRKDDVSDDLYHYFLDNVWMVVKYD